MTIKNTGTFDIPDLFVVDRRGGYAWYEHRTVKAGEEMKIGLVVNARRHLDPATTARGDLKSALLQAGLFETEAESLLTIWSPAFFAAPGISVFYVLPRSEYDRMLKLDVSPLPKRVVRVGVALHPNMEVEPALAKRTEDLVKQLASADEGVWKAAAAELQNMGPVARRTLEATVEGATNPSVRERAKMVLDAGVDASTYLPPEVIRPIKP